MVDTSYNVYIDSSFIEVTSGEESVSVDFHTSGNNLIGLTDFPTTIEFYNAPNTDIDVPVLLSLTELGVDEKDIPALFYLSNYTYGKLDTDINLLLTPSISGAGMDLITQYRAGKIVTLSGTVTSYVNLIIGQEWRGSLHLPVSCKYYNTSDYYVNAFVDYINYTGTLTISGTPLDKYISSLNRPVEYEFNGYVDSGLSHIVELFLAGWVYYPFAAEISSTILDTYNIDLDIELEEYGTKNGMNASATCGTVSGIALGFDTFCGLTDYYELPTDISLISGTKNNLSSVVQSTDQTISYLSVDIALFPIYFDNFTLTDPRYAPENSSICVDAHDGLYNLIASGTYFRIGDAVLSGTTTSISGGYTICFNPYNYKNLFSGITTLTAHAENDNGDMFEENYYLTSGYIVDFDNKERIGIDYGFNKKVTVRMEAEDLAECPTVITDGYWFVSQNRPNRDLTASINCLKGSSIGTKELASSIYPQSTAYFYGKEFEIEITAEDFAGNAIEPYIINFRIQDKND